MNGEEEEWLDEAEVLKRQLDGARAAIRRLRAEIEAFEPVRVESWHDGIVGPGLAAEGEQQLYWKKEL